MSASFWGCLEVQPFQEEVLKNKSSSLPLIHHSHLRHFYQQMCLLVSPVLINASDIFQQCISSNGMRDTIAHSPILKRVNISSFVIECIKKRNSRQGLRYLIQFEQSLQRIIKIIDMQFHYNQPFIIIKRRISPKYAESMVSVPEKKITFVQL